MNNQYLQKFSKPELISMLIDSINVDKPKLVSLTQSEIKGMKVPQLKALAKSRDICGYSRLNKDGLIKLFTPISKPRTVKPVLKRPMEIPPLSKSVKQLAKEFDAKRLPPPSIEWLEDLETTQKPIPEKPESIPRIEIWETNKALKGYTKSFEIEIINNWDPEVQLQNTRKDIGNHIENLLTTMKGL